MKVLIFLIVYIMLGWLVDIWVQRKFKKPNLIMVIVWPWFLLISLIIMCCEKNKKKEIADNPCGCKMVDTKCIVNHCEYLHVDTGEEIMECCCQKGDLGDECNGRFY